ncbi:MAG: globin [Nocardioidaceae bacterium]|nr:MAG: globin [Nocardioidaceae bacterium]
MPTIERIVHRFYQGVVTDEVLKPMYNPDYLADGSAEKRLTLFLAQYWGGPTIYSEARGHPRLRMRHAPYAITPTARERWLKHFRVGLDEVALAPELDAQFWGYVQHAAEFLVNTDEPA